MSFKSNFLSDIALVIDSLHKTPKYAEVGYPMVRVTDIKYGRLNLKNTLRVNKDVFEEFSKKYKPDVNDIIVSRVGSYGNFSQVEDGIFCLGQNTAAIKPNRIDSNYLYACLNSKIVKEQIEFAVVGSTQKTLSLKAIKELKIPRFEASIEQGIGEFLKVIDDRITLLRASNTTLEAIAQALFKSWFVDFDPVHAKQQGRTPEGMDAQTAALFPDSFEESELGMVPKGWRVGAFAELIKLHKGSVNPSASPSTIFQHYSLPAYDAAQLPVAELGVEIKSNKTSVPIDGVLLSKLNPHIPRVWLPSKVEANSVCSTEFLPFVPVNGATTALVYTWLSSAEFIAELSQLVTGTSNSHQRIKPDSVLSMQVLIPPKNVMQGFDEVVGPLFEKVKANRLMAYSLSSLRDTLLPRLISGQLRLPEAQALVDDAVDA